MLGYQYFMLVTFIGLLFGPAVANAQVDKALIIDVEAIKANARPRVVGEVMEIGRNQKAPGQQLIVELRPLFKAELFFLKMVVPYDAETKQRLGNAMEEKLAKTTDMVIENRNVAFGAGTAQQIVAQTASGIPLKANPYTRVRSDMLDLARDMLAEPQFATYSAEWDKRNAFEREAMVDALVTMLDRKLFLSKDQRESIVKELSQGSENVLDMSLEFYQSNPNFIPDIPFKALDGILNPEQRKIWRGLQKYQYPLLLGNQGAFGAVDWDNLEPEE